MLASPARAHPAASFPSLPPALTSFTARIGATGVCYLAGELDDDTRSAAASALRRAQLFRPERLCVVLTRITFMSAAGLNLLLEARRHLAVNHAQLYLVAPSARVTRLLDLTETTGLFPMITTVPLRACPVAWLGSGRVAAGS
ncbi:STAS domain-containing protein [Kitasatospora sp. NPDC059973]|uniref:STAS domain-containing protein n=1 Tax=Kitasatospora sp. NPDC059973 TaxID=3347020 RepID=UPI0036B79BF7